PRLEGVLPEKYPPGLKPRRSTTHRDPQLRARVRGGGADLQVRPTSARCAMHIAFFNRSFYPDTTATSQLLTDLCEDLIREHGCRVSVVAGMPLLPSTAGAHARGVLTRETHHGI